MGLTAEGWESARLIHTRDNITTGSITGNFLAWGCSLHNIQCPVLVIMFAKVSLKSDFVT